MSSSIPVFGNKRTSRRDFVFGIHAAALTIATAATFPSPARAQSGKVMASMSALKAKARMLGAPKVEGSDTVGNRDVPGLYFGTNKMNNVFKVVDDVVSEHGGTATLLVKAGDDYVRIATNVKKEDGSRATGTILDPNGPAIKKIKVGEPYYGEAMILGKPYDAGYEPIKNGSGAVIGIYYVGFLK